MEANALQSAPARLLRLPEVERRTGFKKSQLYKAINGGAFPTPVKLGRATAFVEAEIDEWVRARIADRDGSAAHVDKLLVTEAELAPALGVSVSWLQKDRTADSPVIPFVKLGTSVRYDLEEARTALKKLHRKGRSNGEP